MTIFKVCIPLLAILFFVSCEDKPAINYVILSGTIKHPIGDTIKIRGNNIEYQISLAPDSTFLDTLTFLEAGYFTLIHGEIATLYLEPGYQIDLKLNTTAFDESLTFTGVGAEPNNYLIKKLINKEALIPSYKEFYLLEELEYVSKNQEIKKIIDRSLDSLKFTSPSFYELELRNIEYDYLTMLVYYESSHAYYTENTVFKASDTLLAPFLDFDYDNSTDYEYLPSYRNLVASKFVNYQTIMSYPDTISYVMDNIKQIKSENIRNGLMKSFRYYLSPSFGALTPLYEGIMEISTNEKDKEEITIKYEKVKKLSKGAPAPKFNYTNYAGGSLSMEDLLGKYIYFDIWATWCGPCIQEIPYLKEIEKNYHGSNIQFVSVSIDPIEDLDKWKKFVAEKALGGIQLYADGDWSASIITDYAIEGIPRFILVDPNGNIVTADAPRPSNPQLTALLDVLTQ
jgi:thiol-disulfide isomerase/thioredoxin|tara:strand:- start:9237 stop:10601 length:1365 start_codon:yes stop_codon:yes gene_type:complete